MTIQAAQVSIDIEASPARVWKALTTPAVLGGCFFGSEVVTDYQVGSPILFRGEWKGKRFEDKGRIQVLAPPKQLSFTHWSPLTGNPDLPENYHQVTFDVAQSGAATRVTVTQENLDGKPVSAESGRELAKNWAAILGALKKAVESSA